MDLSDVSHDKWTMLGRGRGNLHPKTTSLFTFLLYKKRRNEDNGRTKMGIFFAKMKLNIFYKQTKTFKKRKEPFKNLRKHSTR